MSLQCNLLSNLEFQLFKKPTTPPTHTKKYYLPVYEYNRCN